MKTYEQIRKILNRHRDEIKRKYKAEILGVFGSYARNEQKADSDVDILVHFLEGASLFDFVSLGEFLEELLEIKVDVVSERTLRKEIREQILNEVQPV